MEADVIILEGPDGAGKTTLKESLQTRYGFDEGVRGTADRSKLYTVTVQDTFYALRCALGNLPPVIWDRLYFSELVYAKIVGRPVEFTALQQRIIQGILQVMDVPIIYCRPPLSTVKRNAQRNEQMDGVLENLEHIYIDYDNVMLHTHAVHYDYTVHDPKRVYDYIDKYLDERNQRTW